MHNKKELIIQQAMILFSQKGYYGVGLNELLSSCQIPKGSFYHFFPNGKKQLAIETLNTCYLQMESSILNHNFNLSNNALEIFERMIQRLSLHIPYQSNGHTYYSLILSFMGIESVFMDEDISNCLKEIYIRWQKLYENKLIQCGYEVDKASLLAQVLFALVHGSLISSWIKQDASDLIKIKSYLPIIFSN